MVIIIVILSIISIVFLTYIILLQLQLRNINRQLTKRLKEPTRQPISLELFNKELNSLAININKCLKAEEQLRIDNIREEKHFKETIANISHDLRTPLTAIKGYQQLMQKEELSEDQLKKLKIAQKYADELGGLIDHFFEYSYLVNVEPIINYERINLTNLITECLAESVNDLEKNNLSVSFEDKVPVIIFADREITTRIIQNLIRNCIQHSIGEIKVNLYIDQSVILSFRNPVDNINDIDVKQLFDRFYTADKTRIKSTGLGLSIVKLLAEQMGGRTSASLQENIIDIRVELPMYK